MTTVGVVIPSHNPQRKELLRAIASVRAQTFEDWDLVIVDDGSDPPIVIDDAVVITQDNRGVSSARNRGVAAVGGSYLAFLDDDDYWHPEKLGRQLAFMREHDLAMCDTDFNIVREGEILATGYEYHGGDFFRLLSTARIGLSTLIVRRDAFNDVGGFIPSFPITQDWELELRVAHAGYKFDRLREVLSTYHVHDMGVSADYRAAYIEQNALLSLYETLDRRTAVREAVRDGRRRMRELYAFQAVDAYRSSRHVAHLAWAAARSPAVVARSILAKARTYRARPMSGTR